MSQLVSIPQNTLYPRICFPLVQSASEDTKLRASLEEKTQLIQSLREEVIDLPLCIVVC